MSPDHRVFVSLGSNLECPARQVLLAVDRMCEHPSVSWVNASSLYQSEPWGNPDQPEFINAVAEVRTTLVPGAFLSMLLETERLQGRQRDGNRWGPRVVDLDLLAWGGLRIWETGLKVPHPRLAERRFVLLPWAEIAPDFPVPDLGRVQDLLERCPDSGRVTRLSPEEAAPPVAEPVG